MYLEKSRGYNLFTWLCSITLFNKIIFLLNQMIIEIDTRIKFIKQNQMKKKYLSILHLLEAISKN
jgi:hypothetical protein